MFRDNSAMRKHLHTHGPRVHVCAECGKVTKIFKLQYFDVTICFSNETSQLCIYECDLTLRAGQIKQKPATRTVGHDGKYSSLFV